MRTRRDKLETRHDENSDPFPAYRLDPARSDRSQDRNHVSRALVEVGRWRSAGIRAAGRPIPDILG